MYLINNDLTLLIPEQSHT